MSGVEWLRLGWKVARVSRPVGNGITGPETRATKLVKIEVDHEGIVQVPQGWPRGALRFKNR